MPFELSTLALIFSVTLVIYYFTVRCDCRWLALVFALAVTGLAAAIWRFVASEALARMMVEMVILAMLGLTIPVRYGFGDRNASRVAWRQHHIKTTRFLPW